ncbi:hypothetical protein GCM10022252_16730 [Streptosporangium oxazolinicum]|uniref:XRE family transcriptional regulator n=1 Tax=Streptosporangium oxazolinicum TaxID=909287 RepID=A0ABP8AL45_9ACTN
MDIATLNAAARRFPLLGRPRPACPSLPERVKEIIEIAAAAGQQGADGMVEGAHALNKAALLASDCGRADLARDLCWQHINLYRAAGLRLTVRQARYMLEPVTNLARLQIRADSGAQALRLLEAMYQAVTANTDLVVEGHTLPSADPIGTRQEHHKLREWVWLQYLGDGIRALALAGRWDKAVTLAEAHQGIGVHLMEGRQAAIVARLLRGDPRVARALLEESTPVHPWEQQVASCLRVMCAAPNSAGRDITAMVGHFLGSEPTPGYADFRARLGLTVVTLATTADPDAAGRILVHVATEVIEAGDGYAAREVLKHTRGKDGIRLSDAQDRALSAVVQSSGLGRGAIPTHLMSDLLAAVTTSQAAAFQALADPVPR